jgi:hypothetical protein
MLSTVKKRIDSDWKHWAVPLSSWTSRTSKQSRTSSQIIKVRIDPCLLYRIKAQRALIATVDIVIELTEPFANELAIACIEALKAVSDKGTLITVSSCLLIGLPSLTTVRLEAPSSLLPSLV